jgi:hypothetical protein
MLRYRFDALDQPFPQGAANPRRRLITQAIGRQVSITAVSAAGDMPAIFALLMVSMFFVTVREKKEAPDRGAGTVALLTA